MPKPKWLEGIEQAAHIGMGLTMRFLMIDLVWHWRERTKQWPPGDPIFVSQDSQGVLRVVNPSHPGAKMYCPEARVIDMMNDIRSYLIGGTVTQAFLVGFMIYLIVKVYA